MSYKIYLPIVEHEQGDSVLVAGKLPLFSGDDDENLACGKCKGVIGRGVSTKTVHSRFGVSKRLIAQCTCGALNVIPASTGEK